MKGRVLVGASIAAALLSLSLSSCTTQSSAVSCSPSTAKISWGKGSRTSDVTLGVHILTYTDGASIREDQPKSAVVAPSFTATAIDHLVRDSHTGATGWKSTLISSARHTTEEGAEFAASVPLGVSPVVIAHPVDGTYIVEVGENQYRMPFTVHCAGKAPITGSLTGALTGGTASYAIRCGVPLTADEKKLQNTEVALSYCPKS
jgi:hypothetical protein